MLVRVLKIEGRDAGSVLVPVRKPLRPGRSVLNFVLPQPGVRLVHIADNDGDVLKPAIVAARIDGDWSTFRRQVFCELDELVAEPHSYYAHSQPEYPFEVLVALPGDLGVRYLLERQHFGIEIHSAIHVGDGDADRVYAVHQSRMLLGNGLPDEDLGNR